MRYKDFCCPALFFVLTLLPPFYAFAGVDYKLPYPAGSPSYLVTQGNNADTNGDQQVDTNGDHGCFTVNTGECDSKSAYASDFAMPKGSLVAASAEGTVRFTESRYGDGQCSSNYVNQVNYVIIDHVDGKSTTYLHLDQGQVFVKPGDYVFHLTSLVRCRRLGVLTLHFMEGNIPFPRRNKEGVSI